LPVELKNGVDKNVLEKIISTSPGQVVYISCDPATLARDTRRLVQEGYNPVKFIPIDLFSQTYHIETLSHWIKS
jgi:23S rRNA (uracil1939-C5)-methyltransferase